MLLKGVHTGEDARLAVEHGAAAVIVSNHGGRQLDGVAATLDVLPEVVEAVAGRCEVLIDGGIRRGTDVAIALGLGARAVLAGRAPLWGLAVGGEAGALRVLELLRDELELALTLLGCASPQEVGADHVSACRVRLGRVLAVDVVAVARESRCPVPGPAIVLVLGAGAADQGVVAALAEDVVVAAAPGERDVVAAAALDRRRSRRCRRGSWPRRSQSDRRWPARRWRPRCR